MPAPLRFLTKVLSPNTIEIIRRGRRGKPLLVTVAGSIEEAQCSRGVGRIKNLLWVALKDGRMLTFNATNGQLLHERPNPIDDRRLQGRLDRILADRNSNIRQVVVFAVSKHSNGFYDFSTGHWHWNQVPDTATFESRKIAEAAAKILNRQRREIRGEGGKIIVIPSRPLQVAAIRKVGGRVRFLEKVKNRTIAFIPVATTAAG
jgi:hypothetical protein